MGKMKWWHVSGTVTVSAYRYVRAETEKDAIEAARGSNVALCPYGPDRSGTTPIEEAIVDEADGDFEPGTAYEEAPPRKYLDEADEADEE